VKLYFLALAALVAGTALAGKAHEHGAARLDIAVDAQGLNITLTAPLESLLGFERAPRTDAERRAVAALQSTLRDGARLFRFDAGARCASTEASLHAPVLGLGAAAAARGEHADLDASWQFHCATPATSIDTALFETFAPLRRIDVQVVAARGQRKLVLSRPARRIALTP
jgi:Protein of unknown function (DUF2796)